MGLLMELVSVPVGRLTSPGFRVEFRAEFQVYGMPQAWLLGNVVCCVNL